MPPLPGLTSNTAIPKGWLRKSGEEMSIFLLPPLKSMLDSWCSLESTQYKRWVSKSWGGKRGQGTQAGTTAWISAPLYLPLPTSLGQASDGGHSGAATRKHRRWRYEGDAETRPGGPGQWSGPRAGTAPSLRKAAGLTQGDSIGPLDTV